MNVIYYALNVDVCAPHDLQVEEVKCIFLGCIVWKCDRAGSKKKNIITYACFETLDKEQKCMLLLLVILSYAFFVFLFRLSTFDLSPIDFNPYGTFFIGVNTVVFKH